MKRDEKSEVIEQIAAQINQAKAIYALDYRGLTVSGAAQLRASLRDADASFRIVKNTLTLRAADQAGAGELKPVVAQGPTALAFVLGDPALAAKVLDTFARQTQTVGFKGGLMDGTVLSPDDLRQIARLPARDQLNAQLAGMVASPLVGLVRGLGSLISGVTIALEQLRQQKEEAA